MALHSVLFDLDGVLLDTEGIYTEFWAGIDRLYPTGVADFALAIKGNTLPHILATYFPDEAVQADIRLRLADLEANMPYRPFEGAFELLEALREAGVSTAIVTSSNAAKMRRIFAALPRLEALTNTLVTDEDVTASKPDPQGYLLAAERLGAKAGEFVVVEDSYAGLEAGRRAGALVVGFATTNPMSEVARRADMTFENIGKFDLAKVVSSF